MFDLKTLVATTCLMLSLAGCDRSEPGSENAASATTSVANAAPATACDDYRKSVRATCLESYRDGLPVSCHRITTRANIAIAADNQDLCASNHDDLKAERAKKLAHTTDTTLGEACQVFVQKFDDVCLSRLGSDFPAPCGGVMVAVGEVSGESEEACRSNVTILGRL